MCHMKFTLACPDFLASIVRLKQPQCSFVSTAQEGKESSLQTLSSLSFSLAIPRGLTPRLLLLPLQC